MSATAQIFGEDSSDFLSNLLQDLNVQKQQTQFNDLSDVLITKVFGYVPLRERFGMTRVSRRVKECVDASVISVNFYLEGLDLLPDEQLKNVLRQHGKDIRSVNFDLYKSTYAGETSQWIWRQSLLSVCLLCPSLTELNVLVCNRHRLRDNDLVSIFEKCPNLKKLCVDAQFMNGHCFQKAPLSLVHVELEMCYRISEASLTAMLKRFRNMRVLHVSQLLILSDAHLANLVRSFKRLQVLSIVSHVDTKYEQLSGPGLAELGKLQDLRVLCLEGLGAVTDRTLNVLSDTISYTSSTLNSLSLAFCYNISIHGIKNLSRMTGLENLNLDGITKRDISIGIEKIAKEGRLVRLFMSERTNVSPDSLLAIVKSSPKLRLLDISTNEEILNWVVANDILHSWSCSIPLRPPLTILTDEHLAWNIVTRPPIDLFGRDPVNIVHIYRAAVPSHEVLPTSVLSSQLVQCLPHGLFAPHLRRGNRYRLLWAPLGPTKEAKFELFEEKENAPTLADILQQSNVNDEMVNEELIMEGEMNGMEDETWPPGDQLDPSSPAYLGFSPHPISEENNPHTKDWSMDVMALLLRTYAFKDGAMVGRMKVREGIVFREDGTVEDISSSILEHDPELRARYLPGYSLTSAEGMFRARTPILTASIPSLPSPFFPDSPSNPFSSSSLKAFMGEQGNDSSMRTVSSSQVLSDHQENTRDNDMMEVENVHNDENVMGGMDGGRDHTSRVLFPHFKAERNQPFQSYMGKGHKGIYKNVSLKTVKRGGQKSTYNEYVPRPFRPEEQTLFNVPAHFGPSMGMNHNSFTHLSPSKTPSNYPSTVLRPRNQ